VGLLPEGDDGLQPVVAAPVVRQRAELAAGSRVYETPFGGKFSDKQL
jgi:hypothetical protein